MNHDLYPQFKGLATAINMFASAPFAFLPVLIGFSATKKFGGNPYLGAAMLVLLYVTSSQSLLK